MKGAGFIKDQIMNPLFEDRRFRETLEEGLLRQQAWRMFLGQGY